MAKVIVTRPRSGARIKTRRRKAKQSALRDPETAPRRAKIVPHYRTKWLNEHLAPLQRYLWKQRGRPWSKVYSEICANLRPTSTVQQHVRDHVEDFVITNVREENGRLVAANRHGRPLEDVREYTWCRGPRLYVCPRSGLLKARRLRRRSRAPDRSRHGSPTGSEEIRVSPDLLYRRIDGLWYALELAEIPASPDERRSRQDALLRKRLDRLADRPDLLVASIGTPHRFVTRKRQLGKRELRVVDHLIQARERSREGR